jgi:hypothetical protein
MLRVLKPGGTFAFSTWPPEVCIGLVFSTVGRYSPPPAPGISPSPQWGDVAVVRQRLGGAVRDVEFDRDVMLFPALSPAHYRDNLERSSGPVLGLVRSFRSDPARLAQLRHDLDEVAGRYFDPERNVIRMDYLMTRATKL